MTVTFAEFLGFRKMPHYVTKGINTIYEECKGYGLLSTDILGCDSESSCESGKNRFNFRQVELEKKLTRSIEVLSSENHSSKYKDIAEIATFFQTLPFFAQLNLTLEDAADLVSVL